MSQTYLSRYIIFFSASVVCSRMPSAIPRSVLPFSVMLKMVFGRSVPNWPSCMVSIILEIWAESHWHHTGRWPTNECSSWLDLWRCQRLSFGWKTIIAILQRWLASTALPLTVRRWWVFLWGWFLSSLTFFFIWCIFFFDNIARVLSLACHIASSASNALSLHQTCQHCRHRKHFLIYP